MRAITYVCLALAVAIPSVVHAGQVYGTIVMAGKGATARDIRKLIERARDAVRLQCGVTLRDEIVYLGEW